MTSWSFSCCLVAGISSKENSVCVVEVEADEEMLKGGGGGVNIH